MKQLPALAALSLPLAAPILARAQGQQLASLACLAGCWAAEAGEAGSGEQWLAPAGGTMLGVGRTVQNGKTVSHEGMRGGALRGIDFPLQRVPCAGP